MRYHYSNLDILQLVIECWLWWVSLVFVLSYESKRTSLGENSTTCYGTIHCIHLYLSVPFKQVPLLLHCIYVLVTFSKCVGSASRAIRNCVRNLATITTIIIIGGQFHSVQVDKNQVRICKCHGGEMRYYSYFYSYFLKSLLFITELPHINVIRLINDITAIITIHV